MPTPTTIAFYSGVIVEGDAVSASLRAKLAALRNARWEGLQVETVAFCEYTNVDDPAIREVPGGVLDLVTRPEFRRASLHVFEFGIHYQLFNVAHLLPPDRMAAVYHNITPRELVVDPLVQAAIERSTYQKHLLARMSHVVCDSEFSQLELLDFGIPTQRLSVLPLPGFIGTRPTPQRGRRPSAEPVRFLFVGRLVRAKGVLDLLAAVARLIDSGETRFEVVLAGRVAWSDSVVTQAITRALEDPAIARFVRFMADVSSEDLAAAYAEADVFVIPSYHEGYCIPVVEAFGACCPVIAYDNTNLPLVSGGLADLVPTGDVDAFAWAMRRAVEGLRTARSQNTSFMVTTASGSMPEEEWREAVLERVRGLQEVHDDGFVALVRDLLRPAPLVPA